MLAVAKPILKKLMRSMDKDGRPLATANGAEYYINVFLSTSSQNKSVQPLYPPQN
jgi:hypothetical protein